MADSTSPDGIVYTTTGDNSSLQVIDAQQASSVQAALDKRQRYDYVWSNAAARTSQTGMVQGSRGYQADTKTEYLYDGGAWRLSTPYAEFSTTSLTVPNNTYTAISPLTYDAGSSSSSNFVTSGTGTLTFVDPGIYIVNQYGRLTGAGFNGSTFTSASPDAVRSTFFFVQPYTGGISTAATVIRTTGPNVTVYFWTFQNSGASQTYSGTIRIARLG